MGTVEIPVIHAWVAIFMVTMFPKIMVFIQMVICV